MFNSVIRYVLPIIILSILSSCKTEYSIDIYASDLFVDTSRPTSAHMTVQIPSCEIKKRYESKILTLFSLDSKAQVVDCFENDAKSYILLSFIVKIENETSHQDVILFRNSVPNVEHEGKQYEFVGIKPVFNEHFLQRSNDLLRENFLELSYKDITIKFNIINDERDSVLLSGNNLWVDGMPHYRFHRQPIARRQSVEIQLSDVMSDLIIRDTMPVAFWVGRLK